MSCSRALPRAAEARNKVREAGLEHLVAIRVGNALEADFSEATAIFLYLVPRGLRIMLPLLRAHPTARRVVTYITMRSEQHARSAALIVCRGDTTRPRAL